METAWIIDLAVRTVLVAVVLAAMYFWISSDDWDDGA
jgi:hypothetical protein